MGENLGSWLWAVIIQCIHCLDIEWKREWAICQFVISSSPLPCILDTCWSSYNCIISRKLPFSRIWISMDQSRDTRHRPRWALNRRWCHPCLGSTWAHLISKVLFSCKKRMSHKSIDALSFDYCYTIVFLFWMHLNRPFLYSEWPWLSLVRFSDSLALPRASGLGNLTRLSPAKPCSDQNLWKIAEKINKLPRKSWFVDSKTG